MEDITLDKMYKEILEIKKRITRVENLLSLPEVEVSEEELLAHGEIVKNVLEGKEGVSLKEYKKQKGIK